MNQIPLFALLIILVTFVPAMSQEKGWGDFKGQIVVKGEYPAIEKESIDRDQPTCLADRKAPDDDNLIINGSGELKDAFVMMYLKKGEPAPEIHESYEKTKLHPVELDNKQCRFVPHALFLRTGQPLRLKNSDDVGHNCHITLFNNEENVNIPIGEHVDVKLNATEKVPGNVVCDIHKWMDAVLLVRDEPYVAITDAEGKFEIKNIPAGTWKFQFWHKRIGYMRTLEVPNHKVGRRGEIKITIEDGEKLDLGKLNVAGSSFKKR